MTDPTVVYADNHLCVAWTTEDGSRKKDVELRYLICLEPISNEELKLKYCSILEIVPDILTNSLNHKNLV